MVIPLSWKLGYTLYNYIFLRLIGNLMVKIVNVVLRMLHRYWKDLPSSGTIVKDFKGMYQMTILHLKLHCVSNLVYWMLNVGLVMP